MKGNTEVVSRQTDRFFSGSCLDEGKRSDGRHVVSRRCAHDNPERSHGRLGLAFLVVSLAATSVVAAQGFPGGGGGPGGGGHGGHGQHNPPDTAPEAPPHVPNPMLALLSGMHDLRGKLQFTQTQSDAWSQMVSALRDCVLLMQSQQHAVGGAADPPADAMIFVGDMSDRERAVSTAMDRVATTMQAALNTLDESQRATCNTQFAAIISTDMYGTP